MAVMKPVVETTFCVPDVVPCRQCQITSGIAENMGLAVGVGLPSLCQCFLFKSYFHFLFRGRHLGSRCWSMSGRVGIVKSKSGMAENVGGSRWNHLAVAFPSKVITTSGSDWQTDSTLPIPTRDLSAMSRQKLQAGENCRCHNL